MKKNLFLKNVVAAMALVLSISMGLTSCGKVDNPLEEIINTVVTNTGASPEEVTALLEAAVSDAAVQEALSTGQPIKVTISGSSTASDEPITIPMTAAVGDAKVTIELTFTGTVTTSDDNPLEFKAEGTTDDTAPTTAENNLTISMPDITGLVITIDLPKTTVTLTTNGTNTVYKSVTAKTATNTLIVGEGVTIENLEVAGGKVVVKNGGKIENLVFGSNFSINASGAYSEDVTKESDGKPIYFRDAKVKEGAKVEFTSDGGEGEALEDGTFLNSLTIGKGATLSGNYRSTPIKEIIGEGEQTAKLIVQGEGYYGIQFIKKITNASIQLAEGVEGTISIQAVPIENCIVTVPTGVADISSDELDNQPNIYYSFERDADLDMVTLTIKGCTFKGTALFFYAPRVGFIADGDNTVNKTQINVIFEDCNFDCYLICNAPNEIREDGTYTTTFTFKNCKRLNNEIKIGDGYMGQGEFSNFFRGTQGTISGLGDGGSSTHVTKYIIDNHEYTCNEGGILQINTD